jgi:outer membrane protein insertion porin family/translocation and assembly module TamA
MSGERRRRTSWDLSFLLACAMLFATACHEEGIKVTNFTLEGVHAFKPTEVLNVLATRKSGMLPWSRKHGFDKAQFEADLKRIQAFYVDRGYPNARVTSVDAKVNDKRDAVSLHIVIDEGAPVVVDDVRYEGFEALPEAARATLHQLPQKTGAPRDHAQVKATRDAAARLLRDNGYPQAYVDAGERPSQTPGHVVVTFRADPGPEMTFGEVTVDGLEHVQEQVVRRELAFKAGALFRERQITRTQRRLSSLEIFQLVSVMPRPEQADGPRVPVRVTVVEAPPRRLTFGIGYGSEERARGSIDWRHLNFMGGARQARFEAKASRLERGLRLTFTEPYFKRSGLSLNVSALAWRSNELIYDSDRYGGRVGIAYRHEARLGPARDVVRWNARATYVHEYLRYSIDENHLDDLSSRAERIALGLNPDTGRGAGTLAGIDLDVDRSAVDVPQDPHRGVATSLHYEHAAPWLLGSYRYDEVLGEARGYVPVGPAVLAVRGQAGSVLAADPSKVPFSKLYFLGGATSLRGWGRYEVSSLDLDGLPIGGRSMVVASAELRVPITRNISAVAFVDAGSVGGNDVNADVRNPRADAGPGLRWHTPIGPIRVDVGFQLNPIPGLIVNGERETRHWRVHFSIGQAF